MSNNESVDAMRLPDPVLQAERHARILAAAERVFAREGFHQATMPMVASEAGMSAGNLYRYFESKEAIIEAFVAQERAAAKAAIATLAEADDLIEGFIALAGRYLAEPKEELAVALEIAAEACRNPRIAATLDGLERETRAGLGAILEAAKAKGQVDPDVDIGAAITLLVALADGLGWRRFVDAGYRDAPTLDALRVMLGRYLRPSVVSVGGR